MEFATTDKCYMGTKGEGSGTMQFFLKTDETSTERVATIATYNAADWLDQTTNEVDIDCVYK